MGSLTVSENYAGWCGRGLRWRGLEETQECEVVLVCKLRSDSFLKNEKKVNKILNHWKIDHLKQHLQLNVYTCNSSDQIFMPCKLNVNFFLKVWPLYKFMWSVRLRKEFRQRYELLVMRRPAHLYQSQLTWRLITELQGWVFWIRVSS